MIGAVLMLVVTAGIAALFLYVLFIRDRGAESGVDVFEEAAAALASAHAAALERLQLGTIPLRDQLLILGIAAAFGLSLPQDLADRRLREGIGAALGYRNLLQGLPRVAEILVALGFNQGGDVCTDDVAAVVSAQRRRIARLVNKRVRRQRIPDPAWGVLVQNAFAIVRADADQR